MSTPIDYWKFIAGLGLFLYGMARLEDALKDLAGKRFKLFLRKYTTNRFLAIFNGAFATSLLQSSTIVLVMVISFAGAGIISLSNSLGIILGANLGTTLTGWLVSHFGFGTDIQSFIYPLIGIGSLGLIFVSQRFKLYHVFSFFVALGLLMMGLGFMKDGMISLATIIDVKRLTQFGMWAFFLFGFIVTATIQSSSAMMTITLSALYANVIALIPAAFIAIGADLGTTMTALIASQKGTAVKKRVGLAHFLFNVGTAVAALLLLEPILHFLQDGLKINDPMYVLVAFHSSFNALGILIFLPFLGAFEKLLNRFFIGDSHHACIHIHKVSTEVPEASIEAIRLELQNFAQSVLHFNLQVIGAKHTADDADDSLTSSLYNSLMESSSPEETYRNIKKTEGELLSYFALLQREKLDDDESTKLARYISGLRSGVESAKAAKDIQHNIHDFHQSIHKTVEELLLEIQRQYSQIQLSIHNGLQKGGHEDLHLDEALIENQRAYQKVNQWIYQLPQSAQSSDERGTQIATFLNVNREIHNSNRLLIESLKDILS